MVSGQRVCARRRSRSRRAASGTPIVKEWIVISLLVRHLHIYTLTVTLATQHATRPVTCQCSVYWLQYESHMERSEFIGGALCLDFLNTLHDTGADDPEE